MANPIVLLHGFTNSTARTWGETGMLDLLRDAGRDVHGIDLLGHGTNDTPHDPAAYAALEDDALARFPDGEVDGIGYSLGARTLLALAARVPERFGRLVVAGVGANLFRDETGDAIADAIEGKASPDDVVAQHFAQLATTQGNDPAALAALMRRPRAALTAEQLARVTCPVLVVLGDRDFAGPADPLLEALPKAELRTLRNVDHFATPKDFGFIDATLEFLDALP